MIKKSYFIVFEGIEGCVNHIKVENYIILKKNNIDVVLTREPGGTKSAELIRNLILKDYFQKNQKEKFDKYTDTLLYLAARNEHVKNKIRPALDKKIVICDRFIDLTIAYQVYEESKFNIYYNIHKMILKGLKPNITFVLKVNSKSSRNRLLKEKVKIDMIISQNLFIIRLKILFKNS